MTENHKIRTIAKRYDITILIRDEIYCVVLVDKKTEQVFKFSNKKLSSCIQHAWYHNNRTTAVNPSGRPQNKLTSFDKMLTGILAVKKQRK